LIQTRDDRSRNDPGTKGCSERVEKQSVILALYPEDVTGLYQRDEETSGIEHEPVPEVSSKNSQAAGTADNKLEEKASGTGIEIGEDHGGFRSGGSRPVGTGG